MSIVSLLWQDNLYGPYDFQFSGAYTSLPELLVFLGATYTRNSTKYVLQNGALVALSANQFGTSYDPVTGLYGYLPETAATNLLQNSGLTGGGAAPTNWTQPVATGTSAAATSTYNAYGVAYSQTATAERPFIQQTIAVSANTTYTIQIYIESVTGGLKANDCISFATYPAGATLTYPASQANPSGGFTNAITTGVLTCQLVVAGTAGTTLCRAGIGANGSATGTLRFSSPQVETGLYASSWILTPVGGTAARAADVLTVPLANVAGFSSAGYTLFVDGRRPTVTTDEQRMMAISDLGVTNRALISANSSSQGRVYCGSGGVDQASITINGLSTSRFKLSSSLSANAIKLALNGTAGTEDTSASLPVSPTTLQIGYEAGGARWFNGYIFNAKLITRALSQPQINGLTS